MTLPPGCDKLATWPLATGSKSTKSITMGIAGAPRLMASNTNSPRPATMTSGPRATTSATVAGSVVGEDAFIGDGAALIDAILGAGVRVGAGARIGEGAVVGDGASIAAGVSVDGSEPIPTGASVG